MQQWIKNIVYSYIAIVFLTDVLKTSANCSVVQEVYSIDKEVKTKLVLPFNKGGLSQKLGFEADESFY